MSAPAAEEGKRGVHGKVAENKKEEMSAEMQSAVALIKTYIPPDPAKIQACKVLPDGTGYPSTIKMDMPAQALGVAVTNSAYQKKAN